MTLKIFQVLQVSAKADTKENNIYFNLKAHLSRNDFFLHDT